MVPSDTATDVPELINGFCQAGHQFEQQKIPKPPFGLGIKTGGSNSRPNDSR